MVSTKTRPKPLLIPEVCKGCGRCIEACNRGCIHLGTTINQQSGYIPVTIDLDKCNGCGLCITACPEPYGLQTNEFELVQPTTPIGEERDAHPLPASIPDRHLPLAKSKPLILKGNHAAAVGALLAGCRHVFGYPITPSTEGAELMASLLSRVGGVFFQAVSEVATINHLYGSGGAGIRAMTFTSSPGFSLMLEGISYMIGAEIPTVIVNVMRGGPGLGNIAPSQSDVNLLCGGLGHGDTHAPVYAPSTPQEMLDFTMKAFDVAFRYRTPVIIAADGYLGQMTGRVDLPDHLVEPGLPDWCVWGDAAHRRNLMCSIFLAEKDLERHDLHLVEKYDEMRANEAMAETFLADDAETLVLACNTPSRLAKGAVTHLREKGVRVGLFRPQTLWPFPIDALKACLDGVKRILVVELSAGQIENELRLALSRAGIHDIEVANLQRLGGVMPTEREIMARVEEVMS